ncbi:MAG: alpha/beta hydrolase [Pseudobdellovibrionaceae bacterium]|nr:alpha/beta hydrolase [Pseudobdellovibrionaceae bacterium]
MSRGSWTSLILGGTAAVGAVSALNYLLGVSTKQKRVSPTSVAGALVNLVLVPWVVKEVKKEWQPVLNEKKPQLMKMMKKIPFLNVLGVEGFKVEVDQQRIYTRLIQGGAETTSRPPAILLAGVGLSGRFMIPLANRLAEEVQVYIPDYPGCGWSDKPADPPNVSELTDIMCKWMDALHIKQAMFVGNSVGSQVAIDLAYRYPDRVAKLVLTGVSPEPVFARYSGSMEGSF